jgi:hypothetical protein
MGTKVERGIKKVMAPKSKMPPAMPTKPETTEEISAARPKNIYSIPPNRVSYDYIAQSVSISTMAKLTRKMDKSHYREYHSLLSRIHSDLASLIYELELNTINQPSGSIDSDIVFDAIPILRQLKSAKKITDQSMFHFNPD